MAILFNEISVNMAELACKRLLAQFQTSTDGIQPYIKALTNQTQSLNNAELTVFLGRTLDFAQGVQLDVIGRIVGQERPIQPGEPLPFFQWDSEDEPARNFDAEAGWWVTNAELTVLGSVPDSIYRMFIRGKIFKNHVFYCSAPEIMAFILITFGVKSSIMLTPGEVFAIDIEVEDTIEDIYVPWLTSFRTDSNVQFEYFLPIAAGVNLNSVTLVPPI